MTVQVEVAALAVSGISSAVPMTTAIKASLLSGLIGVLLQTARGWRCGEEHCTVCRGRRLATLKTPQPNTQVTRLTGCHPPHAAASRTFPAAKATSTAAREPSGGRSINH